MNRFLFFIIIIYSCSSQTNNSAPNQINNLQEWQGDEISGLNKDTLRDPKHQYYLTDLPLRKVGQLILADSIQPSDNQITFKCMDSILSVNSKTRDYYFPVFIKIMDKADGALAEAVGLNAMAFVEKYPKEFAEKSKSLTEGQFKSFASYTGYEIFFAYETEKKAKQWTNSIINNCFGCDTMLVKRLEAFNRLVIVAMKENAEQ